MCDRGAAVDSRAALPAWDPNLLDDAPRDRGGRASHHSRGAPPAVGPSPARARARAREAQPGAEPLSNGVGGKKASENPTNSWALARATLASAAQVVSGNGHSR